MSTTLSTTWKRSSACRKRWSTKLPLFSSFQPLQLPLFYDISIGILKSSKKYSGQNRMPRSLLPVSPHLRPPPPQLNPFPDPSLDHSNAPSALPITKVNPPSKTLLLWVADIDSVRHVGVSTWLGKLRRKVRVGGYSVWRAGVSGLSRVKWSKSLLGTKYRIVIITYWMRHSSRILQTLDGVHTRIVHILLAALKRPNGCWINWYRPWSVSAEKICASGVDTPRATALLFAKLSDSGKRNVQMTVKPPTGYKQTLKSALNVNPLLKRMVAAS